MSSKATNLYMNWTGVTITPQGGAAITVDKVTDVKVNRKSVQEAFYGDNRKFAAFLRNTQKKRSITLVTGNPNLHLAIPEDTYCTIVAILNDVQNGTGSGALTITAVNAKMESDDTDGSNNKYAAGTITFNCAGDDSTTPDSDPVTIAVAADVP